MNTDLKYALALTKLKGVGGKTAKKLLSYSGGYQEVFKLSKLDFQQIDGVGSILANSLFNQINSTDLMQIVNDELTFIDKNEIDVFLFKGKQYPDRLIHCEDGPLVLFGKGNINFNNARILAVVGTRKISPYGIESCEQIIKGLQDKNVLVVSGLAYGVDTYAHKLSVDYDVQTIGVLAHGLDRIYPSINRKLAQKMCDNGGLLTEFMSGTNPDRENFPKRNRIIAGIADATLVIESAKKGGSLITAEIANGYNRDVFAVPGRVGDEFSEGCNYLIKSNKAHLVQNAQDIFDMMGWEHEVSSKPIQQKLFVELTEIEQTIKDAFDKENILHIDQLVNRTGLSNGMIAMDLLDMEFKGYIKALPGKQYKLLI